MPVQVGFYTLVLIGALKNGSGINERFLSIVVPRLAQV